MGRCHWNTVPTTAIPWPATHHHHRHSGTHLPIPLQPLPEIRCPHRSHTVPPPTTWTTPPTLGTTHRTSVDPTYSSSHLSRPPCTMPPLGPRLTLGLCTEYPPGLQSPTKDPPPGLRQKVPCPRDTQESSRGTGERLSSPSLVPSSRGPRTSR